MSVSLKCLLNNINNRKLSKYFDKIRYVVNKHVSGLNKVINRSFIASSSQLISDILTPSYMTENSCSSNRSSRPCAAGTPIQPDYSSKRKMGDSSLPETLRKLFE